MTSNYRSIITRRPGGRLNGRTAAGKRARDLFEGYLERLNRPDDVVTVANVLALSELKCAAEMARAAFLNGEVKVSRDVTQLENLVKRAEERLGLAPGAAEATPLSMADRLAGIGFAMPSDDDETDDDVEDTSS